MQTMLNQLKGIIALLPNKEILPIKAFLKKMMRVIDLLCLQLPEGGALVKMPHSQSSC